MTREQAKDVLDKLPLFQALADGKTIQELASGWVDAENPALLTTDKRCLRVKPDEPAPKGTPVSEDEWADMVEVVYNKYNDSLPIYHPRKELKNLVKKIRMQSVDIYLTSEIPMPENAGIKEFCEPGK